MLIHQSEMPTSSNIGIFSSAICFSYILQLIAAILNTHMLFFDLFCRAVRHEKYLADLVQDKMTSTRSPQMFYQSQQKITSLIDVVPTQKVIYIFLYLSLALIVWCIIQIIHQSDAFKIWMCLLKISQLSWVKAKLSFQHIFQKYYYMACTKCHRMTSANFATTYTCNHCDEKQKASPRKLILPFSYLFFQKFLNLYMNYHTNDAFILI